MKGLGGASAAIESAEDELSELACDGKHLATDFEQMHHAGEVSAAEARLAKLSGRAERKEAERTARIVHVQVVAAPILSRKEQQEKREREIAEDRAAVSIEAEAKARLEAKGKTPTTDPFLYLRIKAEVERERAKASTAATASATSATSTPSTVTATATATATSAVGGAGCGSDAASWRRSSSSSAPSLSSLPSSSSSSLPPPLASSAPRALPKALDTLLAGYPVCYKATGEGRFRIELHNKKLRELCIKEGRDIRSREVEEGLLRALESTGLCTVENKTGSWGSLCSIRV